jgi:hypothetical protein
MVVPLKLDVIVLFVIDSVVADVSVVPLMLEVRVAVLLLKDVPLIVVALVVDVMLSVVLLSLMVRVAVDVVLLNVVLLTLVGVVLRVVLRLTVDCVVLLVSLVPLSVVMLLDAV